MNKKILISGCSGFIGSNLTDRLLKDGYTVVGIDNFNDYYDPKIKKNNLTNAKKNKLFKLYPEDILNFDACRKIFLDEKPHVVVHLAARAGVRPSINDPELYSKVNVEGTVNLLKLSVDFKIDKFIFGSSSSVYGNSKKLPFSENDPCDNVISPYGASKRAAEFFVESFWRSFGLKSAILRFFTVYGPRGRPDMAPAIFVKAIKSGTKIRQFGRGTSERDYTFVDDIVEGILCAIRKDIHFEVINLGNNHPVKLQDFIKLIHEILGKKTIVEIKGEQPGDVDTTWADIDKAKRLFNWEPRLPVTKGLELYIRWLKNI